jgi:hypothetical protein
MFLSLSVGLQRPLQRRTLQTSMADHCMYACNCARKYELYVLYLCMHASMYVCMKVGIYRMHVCMWVSVCLNPIILKTFVIIICKCLSVCLSVCLSACLSVCLSKIRVIYQTSLGPLRRASKQGRQSDETSACIPIIRTFKFKCVCSI